jgi:hypothetical protein
VTCCRIFSIHHDDELTFGGPRLDSTSNFPLGTIAIIDVPTNVAEKYSHKLVMHQKIEQVLFVIAASIDRHHRTTYY